MNNNIVTKRAFALVALTSSALPQIIAAERDQPNIIFILVDDFRYDAMGYCGNPIVHTPAIDNLAESGVVFQNTFASTPISSASRASILTGLQERTHRYTFQTGPLEDRFLEQAYPIALREAGYNTALFGKLGVVCTDDASLFDEIENYDRMDEYPDQRGYYNKVLGADTVHLTRYTGQRGLDFIEKQTGEQPFFMSLCFSAPHAHDGAVEQYFWDEAQDDLFKDVTIPDPAMSDDKYFKMLPESIQNSFSRLRWTWRFDTPEKYQEMMKGYYRMIAGVDSEIEKVRAKLKEKGLDENTVIIFMGDNGYFLGERQLADKWLMYDLSVRIPLVIYDPRLENQHRDEGCQALNIDITQTIADYAGAEAQPQWQGESLRAVVENREPDWSRDAILIEHLWEFASIPPSEGVRTDKWKYFRYINEKSWEELYDLENDPMEAKNLAKNKKYRAVLEQMREKITQLQIEKSLNGIVAPEMISQCAASDMKSPLFSWQVPLVAQAQKAYQIIVSDSWEVVDNNIGNVWDSGTVGGGESLSVAYAGNALESGKRYYWRVRIWDYLNRTSEYSEIEDFVLSELEKSSTPAAVVTSFECSDKSIEQKEALMQMWGFESSDPTCKVISLSPNMSNTLNNCSMSIATARGDVECRYIRTKPRIRNFEVEIPANVTCEVTLPSGLKGCVLLNKKVLNLNHKTLQLEPGLNTIEVQVNSF